MNDWRRIAEDNKRAYPAGTRIQLESMGNDPRPIPSGTRGTVRVVDDIGTVHCDFDNGRRLGLVSGEDSFRKLTAKELAEEALQEKATNLAGKLVDFAKDYDFYDYQDNLEIGATEEDAIASLAAELTSGEFVASLSSRLSALVVEDELTAEQKKTAQALLAELSNLNESKPALADILADANSRKTGPGGPGEPGGPGGTGALEFEPQKDNKASDEHNSVPQKNHWDLDR